VGNESLIEFARSMISPAHSVGLEQSRKLFVPTCSISSASNLQQYLFVASAHQPVIFVLVNSCHAVVVVVGAAVVVPAAFVLELVVQVVIDYNLGLAVELVFVGGLS
jgi:hypothetical protein